MKVLVDIAEADVRALDEIGRRRGEPRSRIIRAAVREYVQHRSSGVLPEAFGLWNQSEDGVDYQRRLRSEW